MDFWNLVGGLANAGASVYSQVQTNKNIDKQLAAQQKENNATREYNLNLAKQQNQWNIEQWNRENAYNTPAAQIERMKQAGLNADMAYGQGALQNASASSPQMTSGAPAMPVDWSAFGGKRSIGSDAVNSFLDAQLKQAQIDNINADTEKKGAESSILTDEAAFKKAFLARELKLKDAEIRLTNISGDEGLQNIKESQARCQQIEAKVSEINVNIQSIYNAINNDNARLELEKALNSEQLKQIAADCNLKYEEANRIRESLDAYIKNLNADTKVKLGQEASLEIANGHAAFEAKLNGKFGYDKELGIFDNYLKCVNRILTTYSSLIGPVSKAVL